MKVPDINGQRCDDASSNDDKQQHDTKFNNINSRRHNIFHNKVQVLVGMAMVPNAKRAVTVTRRSTAIATHRQPILTLTTVSTTFQ